MDSLFCFFTTYNVILQVNRAFYNIIRTILSPFGNSCSPAVNFIFIRQISSSFVVSCVPSVRIGRPSLILITLSSVLASCCNSDRPVIKIAVPLQFWPSRRQNWRPVKRETNFLLQDDEKSSVTTKFVAGLYQKGFLSMLLVNLLHSHILLCRSFLNSCFFGYHIYKLLPLAGF